MVVTFINWARAASSSMVGREGLGSPPSPVNSWIAIMTTRWTSCSMVSRAWMWSVLVSQLIATPRINCKRRPRWPGSLSTTCNSYWRILKSAYSINSKKLSGQRKNTWTNIDRLQTDLVYVGQRKLRQLHPHHVSQVVERPRKNLWGRVSDCKVSEMRVESDWERRNQWEEGWGRWQVWWEPFADLPTSTVCSLQQQ